MSPDTFACSQCGYELTGLGRRGNCPECGQWFDQSSHEGVDDASMPISGVRRWAARHTRSLLILMFGLFGLCCVGMFSLAVSLAGDKALGLLAVLGGAWLFALVASYVDEW